MVVYKALNTTRKSIAADTGHAGGNGDGGQGTATIERRTGDAGHAGGDDKVCYLVSSDIEMMGSVQRIGIASITTAKTDTVQVMLDAGKLGHGQGTTAIERITADAGHVAAYGDGCQARTTTEDA